MLPVLISSVGEKSGYVHYQARDSTGKTSVLLNYNIVDFVFEEHDLSFRRHIAS